MREVLLLTERLQTAGLVLTGGRRPSLLLGVQRLPGSLRGCGLVRVSRHGHWADCLLLLDLNLLLFELNLLLFDLWLLAGLVFLRPLPAAPPGVFRFLLQNPRGLVLRHRRHRSGDESRHSGAPPGRGGAGAVAPLESRFATPRRGGKARGLWLPGGGGNRPLNLHWGFLC